MRQRTVEYGALTRWLGSNVSLAGKAATLTVTIPGRTDVLRVVLGGQWYADLLANTNVPIQICHPTTVTLGSPITYGSTSYRLLTIVDEDGTQTFQLPVGGLLEIEYTPKNNAGNWAVGTGFTRYRVGDISAFTYVLA